MAQTSLSCHQTWWKGRKRTKWSKYWIQDDMGRERSYNISLNGEVISRPMTARSLQNKYMHQSW
jgi:hypothetical protein